MGRSSSFDPQVGTAICERLANGESLRKAAKAEGTTHVSVLRWLDDFPEFSDQYARAREIGYRLLADQILEISDDSSGDVVETENGPKANAEFVARSRLRVDSRKWMLSKMLPKIYGDKLDLTHGGNVTISIAEAVRAFDERRAGNTDVP